MKLISFHNKDFDILSSWIDSKRESLLWAGPDLNWPLIKNEIIETSSLKYFLEYENKKIAFIELVNMNNKKFRLCKIIVKKEYRKRSFAKKMIELVINKSIQDFKIYSFNLNVFKDNQIAISSYKKIGFKIMQEYKFYDKKIDKTYFIYQMNLDKN